MKIIVVGLGNLGTGVSLKLDKKGHNIIAIDTDAEKENQLSKHYKGKFLSGSGLDKNILEKAGIQYSDAVVVSTKSDEVNAVIARVAKKVYRVPTVIARVYDVRKAYIYKKLGIRIISVTPWGIERVTEILTFYQFDSVYTMGDGNINLIRTGIPPQLSGKKVQEITILGELNVVSITRGNHTFIPTLGTVLKMDDLLYLSVSDNVSEDLESMFGVK
jgi:trk system potassium uptake protein TrkA